MELIARLTRIDNAQEGVNKQGNPWRKATAVFETTGNYPKTVAVDFFNAKLDEATKIPLGTPCKVQFDAQSREYNGKWYTNLTAFGIEAAGQAQQQQPEQSHDTMPPQEYEEEQDDLPF